MAEDLLYNLSYLSEISRGDRDFMKKMVDLFIEQVPASLIDINEAFLKTDFPKVKTLAHKAKSSIDTLGIAKIQNEIKELEMLAMQNKPNPRINEIIELLNDVIPKTIAQLKEW
jgi:HPt (histidine-containing phosphotransfer) domain-containing protein